MDPIDKPFRFTWDFCVVWALLALPVFLLIRQWENDPWYSYGALLLLASLLATFFIYGPVLLVRQVIRSGSRGRFVTRVFLSILLVLILFFIGLYVFGCDKHISGLWGGITACIATIYLHWRTDQNR